MFKVYAHMLFLCSDPVESDKRNFPIFVQVDTWQSQWFPVLSLFPFYLWGKLSTPQTRIIEADQVQGHGGSVHYPIDLEWVECVDKVWHSIETGTERYF